jgi:hypothetical protein
VRVIEQTVRYDYHFVQRKERREREKVLKKTVGNINSEEKGIADVMEGHSLGACARSGAEAGVRATCALPNVVLVCRCRSGIAMVIPRERVHHCLVGGERSTFVYPRGIRRGKPRIRTIPFAIGGTSITVLDVIRASHTHVVTIGTALINTADGDGGHIVAEVDRRVLNLDRWRAFERNSRWKALIATSANNSSAVTLVTERVVVVLGNTTEPRVESAHGCAKGTAQWAANRTRRHIGIHFQSGIRRRRRRRGFLFFLLGTAVVVYFAQRRLLIAIAVGGLSRGRRVVTRRRWKCRRRLADCYGMRRVIEGAIAVRLIGT